MRGPLLWRESMKKHDFRKFYQQQQPRADPAPAAGPRQGKGQGQYFAIAKADEDRQMIFGWASVASLEDGNSIIDSDKDIIEIEELETAVYEYVLYFRDGGEMHKRRGIGLLVESVVFTPDKQEAMGIPAGTIPSGWWIGLKITDNAVWEKVKDGTYNMFSIEGDAVRIPVDDDGETEGEETK